MPWGTVVGVGAATVGGGVEVGGGVGVFMGVGTIVGVSVGLAVGVGVGEEEAHATSKNPATPNPKTTGRDSFTGSPFSPGRTPWDVLPGQDRWGPRS